MKWKISEFNKFRVNLKILSPTCPACALVVSWSLTQEMAGSIPFSVMTNILVTEFSEWR